MMPHRNAIGWLAGVQAATMMCVAFVGPPCAAAAPPTSSANRFQLRASSIRANEELARRGSKTEADDAEIGSRVDSSRLPAADEELPPGRVEPAFTLDDAVATALNRSPAIREAANQVEVARGKAYQASLYPNPTAATASPQLAGQSSQYNVFMAQDLVVKGKLRLDTAAASQEVRRVELALVRARFDAVTIVRQRFYAALVAQRRLEVLDELAKIAKDSKAVGDRLFQGGEGTKTDVLVLDIELDRALVAVENAETLLDSSRRQLSASIGAPDLLLPPLTGDLDRELPPYEMLAVQQGVISRNALAQVAQAEMTRNQFLLERAVVDPYPNINVMGGWQYNVPDPHRQGIYQVQVAVPLWNRNQGNIRAAQADVAAATARYRRVQTELASDSAEAVGKYLTARQISEKYKREILPKAREAQRLARQLYEQGQTDFLRLLQAQRTLVEANLNYINAQENRWASAAELAGLLQLEQFP